MRFIVRLVSLRGIKVPNSTRPASSDILTLRPLEFYNIPLKLKNITESEPVVKIGDSVKQGTLIAEPTGNFGVKVFSPVSGKVLNILSKINYNGEYTKHILIMNDNKNEVEDLPEIESISDVTLLERLKDSGMVDTISQMPTYLKYGFVGNRSYKQLLVLMDSTDPSSSVNECVTINKMEEVANGAKYFMNITNASYITFIFTYRNRALAQKLKRHLEDSKKRYDYKIKFIPDKYPLDNPYMLAGLICNKNINKKFSFLDAGIAIETAESCYNFCRAVEFNKPVISKFVTVTGDNFVKAGNYQILNGTSYQNLIEYVGIDSDEASTRLIDGSIMNGIAQYNPDISVSFMTNSVLMVKYDELTSNKEYPCISCGKCAAVCPVYLNPQALERAYLSEENEDFLKLRAKSCIECGCCSYVCPSKRFLAQRIAAGKFYDKKNRSEK